MGASKDGEDTVHSGETVGKAYTDLLRSLLFDTYFGEPLEREREETSREVGTGRALDSKLASHLLWQLLFRYIFLSSFFFFLKNLKFLAIFAPEGEVLPHSNLS